MLTKYLRMAAADLRSVKPTQADQCRNPDVDVMQLWRDDIEHTIRCQGLAEADAQEFRSAVLTRAPRRYPEEEGGGKYPA